MDTLNLQKVAHIGSEVLGGAIALWIAALFLVLVSKLRRMRASYARPPDKLAQGPITVYIDLADGIGVPVKIYAATLEAEHIAPHVAVETIRMPLKITAHKTTKPLARVQVAHG